VSGVAFEFDTRAVVSEDFNLDGRTDLIITDLPGNVYFVENNFKTENHWFGIMMKDEGAVSALGAKVTVSTSAGEKHHQFVSGESLFSQHSHKRVFGLGKSDQINYVEVQWPDGTTKRLDSPKADRYYMVSAKGIKELKGRR